MDPKVYFDQLVKLPWLQMKSLPRKEYYCNDNPEPYAYGLPQYANTYMPQPYTPEILEIRAAVEEVVKANMDVVFLNYYADQTQHLGWHADDSKEMDPLRPIVTVSLGAEREIWARPNSSTVEDMLRRDRARNMSLLPHLAEDERRAEFSAVEKFMLHNGSMFIMKPGMQQTWQHRIPKCDRIVGGRISLTFRGYVKS